jgi:nicotinamide mononucleotide (NMN) deamidase PncC
MSQRALALHSSPWMGTFYVTGGAASLVAEILNTPGASATVLDAYVPYASPALSELLGRAPEQAVSATTARQLAITAFERATALRKASDADANTENTFGFACTASLATSRVKRGAHRAHWAIQTAVDTYTFSAMYNGDRDSEEALLREQIWQTLQHCLLNHSVEFDDNLVELHARANPPLRPLLNDKPYKHGIGDSDGMLLLPGSFNPTHDGHKEMLAIAETMTGKLGAFELAVKNADKPSLDYLTMEERIEGVGDIPLWLTNTPNFEGKAKLFKGTTFVVGVDTLARIGELRFYRNHVDLLDQAMATFTEQDTHFLVFGRLMENQFVTFDQLDIPAALSKRCTGVPETTYRNDTSSTAIRNGKH